MTLTVGLRIVAIRGNASAKRYKYGVGLDGLLNSLHISQSDPVTFVLHLACPHLNYTDRGKSSLEVL